MTCVALTIITTGAVLAAGAFPVCAVATPLGLTGLAGGASAVRATFAIGATVAL